MIKIFQDKLSDYRFEILFSALFLSIFDKVFLINTHLFSEYLRSFNMFMIAIASYGIFRKRSEIINYLRNFFGIISIVMPFLYFLYHGNLWFSESVYAFFILYYIFILVEVLRQITQSKEVRLNVIFGSFCGYMLWALVALYTFLLIEYMFPFSFHGVSTGTPSLVYNQLLYFSFTVLTSNGFGDIYPTTDISRLVISFFGMMGQFYMVAVVGIVVSRFAKR